MQEEMDRLRQALEEFVGQHDYQLLVLQSAPRDNAYSASYLESLDETRDDTLFWVTTAAFEGPEPYVERLANSLAGQVEIANALRLERGEPAFPPLPGSCRESLRTPEERLSELLRHVASLPQIAGAVAMVVALLPTECADPSAFAALLQVTLPTPERLEWMRPLRIVTSDDLREPRLISQLRRRPLGTVLSYEVDFSNQAVAEYLKRSVEDESRSPRERFVAYLQVAALDGTQGRFEEAQEKYAQIYAYYTQKEEDPQMQVLALQGSGDMLLAAGNAELALERLRHCVQVALEHDQTALAIPALDSQYRAASQLGYTQEAEECASAGVLFAIKCMNYTTAVHFLERGADAQLAQGKREDALESLKRSCNLCAHLSMEREWAASMERRIKIHHELGQRDFAQQLEVDLRAGVPEEALDPSGAEASGG